MKLRTLALIALLVLGILTQTGCGVMAGLGCAATNCMKDLILDERDPHRIQALNPMPIDEDVAIALKTSVNGLEQYNTELAAIHVTNSLLETSIATMLKNNSGREEVDSVASGFGISGGARELAQIAKKRKIKNASLHGFADSQGLSDETARLYLQTRFRIEAL